MISPTQQSSILSKAIQVGLLSAMPITISVLGGPEAIWSNSGYTVRAILIGSTLPTAICSMGVLESLVRSIILATQDKFFLNTNPKKDERFTREVKRMLGMARGALFPVNGWAIMIMLPANDYYIYAVPIKIIKEGTIETIDKVLLVAVKVNKVLSAVGFWKVAELGWKITVTPTWKVVKWTTRIAYNTLSWSLGLAKDVVMWGIGSR